MGQRPKELTPHESLHHYWGAELRALRVARGLSLADLGQRVHCNPSYLGKIERGERPIPTTLVDSCDRALDAHGTLIRLHTLARSGRELAPIGDDQTSAHGANNGADVASSAGSLAGGAIFPAAAGTGPESGEDVVAARAPDGRVVFVSVPRRVFLHGIGTLALGATTLPAATQSVTLPADINPIEHFQQLRRVLRDNDSLFGAWRVIPIVREQIAIMQQLRSDTRGDDQRALARVETKYSEFCGYLYQDLREHQLAESWTDRAAGLSHVAGDRDLTAFIFARRAGIAVDRDVAADAVGFAEQALRLAPPRSRITALAAIRKSHGHALRGEHAEAERAYEHAYEVISDVDHDPASPCASWLDQNYITLEWARCVAVLGNHRRAAQTYQAAFAERLCDSRRARGLYFARAAVAHAGDRQVEHAATLGLDALTIAADTRSGRILTELHHLNNALAPWNTVPAVADFTNAMNDTVLRHA